MRIPKAWDDAELLRDEPFTSLFFARATSDEGPRRSGKGIVNWNKRIAEELKSVTDGTTAAMTWLQLAFNAKNSDELTVAQQSHIEAEGMNMFIEFHWRLYQECNSSLKNLKNTSEEATQYLSRMRSKLGFVYQSPEGTLAEVSHPVSRSAKSGRVLRNFRKRRQAKQVRLVPDEVAYDAEAEDDDPQSTSSRVPQSEKDIAMASPGGAVEETHEEAPSDRDDRRVLPITRAFASRKGILQPIITERKESGVVGNKRKADGERPSSPSSSDVPPSHQEDIDHADLSPLTDFSSTSLPDRGMDIIVPECGGNALDGGGDCSTVRTEVFTSIEPNSDRRRPPRRRAANTERLSSMMKRETKYQIQQRRGQITDLAEDTQVEVTMAQAVPSVQSDPEPRTEPSPIVQEETPHGPLHVAAKRRVSRLSVHKKSRKPKVRTGADLPSRPGKRRRGNDELGGSLASVMMASRSRKGKGKPRESLPLQPLVKDLSESNVPEETDPEVAIAVPGGTVVVLEEDRSALLGPVNDTVSSEITDSELIYPVSASTQHEEDASLSGIDTSQADTSGIMKNPTILSGVPAASETLTPSPTLKRPRDVIEAHDVEPIAEVATIHIPQRLAIASSISRSKFAPVQPVIREHTNPLTESAPAHDIQRPIAALPRRSNRNKQSQLRPAVPLPPASTITLADVDSNLRDAAATASILNQELLSAPREPLNDFVDEQDETEGQAQPPDSSDDEVPLQSAVEARKLKRVEINGQSWDSRSTDADDRSNVPSREIFACATSAPVDTAPVPVCTTSTRAHTAPTMPFSTVPPALPDPTISSALPTPHEPTPKPRLACRPLLWAQSRQEVCESFDWFRSYQSGVYFMKDMVKGYLLSAFSSSRDLCSHDGRLIISHGGGKAESLHTKEGQTQTQEADDQLAGDKSVRALLNTHKLGRPVVLLIDDKYRLFPYDLASDGYTYVVLGFYRITHAWAEQEPANNSRGYVVRYKFAFQWCEEQGKPWWDCSQNSGVGLETTGSTDCQKLCDVCNTASPLVYSVGWMCLQPSCNAFWKITGDEPPGEVLEYAESFLRLLPKRGERLEDICPPKPVMEPVDGNTTSRIFCKGWHCTECGRLSCRYKWEHWECQNCKIVHTVEGEPRNPKEFWRQENTVKFMHHMIAKDSGIIFSGTEFKKCGKMVQFFHQYILPENRGRIVLIPGPLGRNPEADKIFKEYQTQAAHGELLFRRWPLRAHKCRGTLLTNYFSQNSGEPYQYVGGTDNTVPMDAAPSAVRGALSMIEQRMQDFLGMSSTFNEVLSAAYMEKQTMAFHSDSERGLEPVVASLSLGSAAYMHFRLHSQYYGETGKGSKRNALSLYLRHGDVVVMDGAGVQKFYEHTVIPMNFRIAATARSINPLNH